MSATDELRAMLSERGVECDYGITGSTTTRFSVNGIDLTFTPMRDGLVCSTILTPEQAIAATLGRGECRLEREPDSDRLWWCSSCRSYHEHVSEFPWEYCPRCGAKVVSE